jgi:hypothetical protein
MTCAVACESLRTLRTAGATATFLLVYCRRAAILVRVVRLRTAGVRRIVVAAGYASPRAVSRVAAVLPFVRVAEPVA